MLGYPARTGWKPVVHGVSFFINRGETFALVGESGSGKSTIARALIKLLPVRSGSIRYAGEEIAAMGRSAFRPWRRKMQLVFQDPWQALNPRATVRQILEEPLRIHFPEMRASERAAKVASLLDQVQLPDSSIDRYPAAFSGGQRQRILIARALAVEPEFLICDEPVSALDVSIQAEILALLDALKERRRLTVLFISHDMAVVHQIADRVGVLEAGRLVETSPRDAIFASPQHPYTVALLDACPRW